MSNRTARRIAWRDSGAGAWHGPTELTFTLRGCGRILSQLRELPGSWYGKLRTEAPEEPPLGFHVSIHDLGDAGLALLDIEGSPGGPLEVVLAIPAQRRARIRPDLAFEFVAFLGLSERPGESRLGDGHSRLHPARTGGSG